MKTINNVYTNELKIKHSRFIACLFPLSTSDEIALILKQVKNKYPNATHYCYAYIFEQEKRVNDDGEPSGTAGIPILNVLENLKLNHILCVVIRYFGGIKLGAGGLNRAYGKATSLVVEKADIGELLPSFIIESIFSYEQSKQVHYLLKNANILKQQFEDAITIQYLISEKDWAIIKEEIEYITTDTKIINSTYQVK